MTSKTVPDKKLKAPPVSANGLAKLMFWRKRGSSQIMFGLLTLFIVLGIYTIARFIPIIQTFRYSLYKWSLAAEDGEFVVLSNFIALIKDDSFLTAFKNTLIFSFSTTPLTLLISLTLAVLLYRWTSPGVSRFYELLFFIPVVISMVPVCVVWKWIYDPRYGLLNYIISLIGISPKAWLLDPKLVMSSVITVSVWKGIGFYLVIFIVGLKNIPRVYYDAAAIDGANSWSKFQFITLPLLKPIILFALVWATIVNLNVFTQVYILTMSYGATGVFGRPVPVLVFDIYNNAFKFFRMGYASAEAVILFIVVLIISLIQFRFFRKSG
jgi:multiple sugar transport system permease protein